MKIIRTNMQCVEDNLKREITRLHSKNCPCCGKEQFGILLMDEDYGGIFHRAKTQYFYFYTCDRCGTQWESDRWE